MGYIKDVDLAKSYDRTGWAGPPSWVQPRREDRTFHYTEIRTLAGGDEWVFEFEGATDFVLEFRWREGDGPFRLETFASPDGVKWTPGLALVDFGKGIHYHPPEGSNWIRVRADWSRFSKCVIEFAPTS